MGMLGERECREGEFLAAVLGVCCSALRWIQGVEPCKCVQLELAKRHSHRNALLAAPIPRTSVAPISPLARLLTPDQHQVHDGAVSASDGGGPAGFTSHGSMGGAVGRCEEPVDQQLPAARPARACRGRCAECRCSTRSYARLAAGAGRHPHRLDVSWFMRLRQAAASARRTFAASWRRRGHPSVVALCLQSQACLLAAVLQA